MVLIDLRKVFESLCHSALLCKLQNLGTSNKALLWFESYLTNRQQSTRVATSLSEPLTITHGVPQGSIPGPTLWACTWMIYPMSSSLVPSNLITLMTLRYIFRSCQRTLIHVYAKLLRISNMFESDVALTTFWSMLKKPSLSYLRWGNLSLSCPEILPLLRFFRGVPGLR